MTKLRFIVLSLWLALGLVEVRAEHPTFSNTGAGGASILTSPTFYSFTNSFFRYPGLDHTNYQHPNASFLQTVGTGISSTNEHPPLIVSFRYTGTRFELKSINEQNGSFRIKSGEGIFDSVPYNFFYANSSPTLYAFTYSSNDTRDVTLEIQGAFAGINVEAGSTIATNPTPYRQLIVVGDSYVEGYNPVPGGQDTRWIFGFASMMQTLTTNLIVIPSGISGTGYTNSFQDGVPYGQRLGPDVLKYATNGRATETFILITGSINDNGYTSNQVYTAGTNIYAQLASNAPNARLMVARTWSKDSTPSAGIQTVNIGQSNACKLFNLPSFETMNWISAGNIATYIGSDSVHPSSTGYLAFAQSLATNIQSAFPSFGTNGAPAANPWSITNFGGIGDLVSFSANTTSNSAQIVVTSGQTFTTNDIGKVLQVFGAGPWLHVSNNNALAWAVTNQDSISFITNVTSGSNIWGTILQGRTTNAYCLVGTNNQIAFQKAIDAAASSMLTNVPQTIYIPTGKYLIASSNAMNAGYVCQNINGDGTHALTITNGGITFLGDGAGLSYLYNVGAGMNHSLNDSSVYGTFGHYVVMRGSLLYCAGPINASQYPLVFNGLTFDGGMTNGIQVGQYFPPKEGTGEGWDVSHHFLVDNNPFPGSPQMHQLKVFTNCVFQHSRGEMLICTTGPGGTNTFNDVINCVFNDGNASAINLYYGQHVYNCSFTNLVKVLEYYQGNTTTASTWSNNVMNMPSGNSIHIVGSTTNALPPDFTWISNRMIMQSGGFHVTFAPASNVKLIGNSFEGSGSTGISCSGAVLNGGRLQ